jgi:hypothetical protein
MLKIESVVTPIPVIQRTSYDYAPSVMLDTDGTYKIWWCAGVAGDFIGYGESYGNLDNFEVVKSGFFANRSGGKLLSEISYKTFDGIHACDPSVVKVDNVYYMYYGGLANHRTTKEINNKKIRFTDYPQVNSIATTHIGVAISLDGINWQRQNSGNPIIMPNADSTNPESYALYKSIYGAGQPSVVYLDSRYYLAYHDSTGKASNRINGAGVYILSSTDPLFQKNVYELRCRGDEIKKVAAGSCLETYWKHIKIGVKPSTKYAIIEAFSPEIAYSDILNSFLLITHHQKNKSRLNFFDLQFVRTTEKLSPFHQAFDIPAGNWRDGPGLLTEPQKHVVENLNSVFTCDSLSIDIFSGNSLSKDVRTWDLYRWGVIINNCTNPLSSATVFTLLTLTILFLFLIRYKNTIFKNNKHYSN